MCPFGCFRHNLRASRATELANEFPAHVAAAWLGHSTLIANKHYWQVTDEDIATATTPANPAAGKAAQKAAQQAYATNGDKPQCKRRAQKKTPAMHVPATRCGTTHERGMGGIGLEPTTSTMSTWRSSQLS